MSDLLLYIYMLSYGYRMVPMAPGTVTNPSIQNMSYFRKSNHHCISPVTFLHTLSLASESKTGPLAVMWLLNWRAPTEHDFSGAGFYLFDLWSAALAVRGFRVISTRQKRSNQPLHSKSHFRLGQNVSFDVFCVYIWITTDQRGVDGSRNQTILWAWLEVSNRGWSNELNLKQKSTWCLYRVSCKNVRIDVTQTVRACQTEWLNM